MNVKNVEKSGYYKMTDKKRSYIRTFVKGVVWELFGLILIYILIHSIQTSLTYIGIRIMLYFIYHRVWKMMKWGAKSGNATLVE